MTFQLLLCPQVLGVNIFQMDCEYVAGNVDANQDGSAEHGGVDSGKSGGRGKKEGRGGGRGRGGGAPESGGGRGRGRGGGGSASASNANGPTAARGMPPGAPYNFAAPGPGHVLQHPGAGNYMFSAGPGGYIPHPGLNFPPNNFSGMGGFPPPGGMGGNSHGPYGVAHAPFPGANAYQNMHVQPGAPNMQSFGGNVQAFGVNSHVQQGPGYMGNNFMQGPMGGGGPQHQHGFPQVGYPPGHGW